jgi:hypothetical protein
VDSFFSARSYCRLWTARKYAIEECKRTYAVMAVEGRVSHCQISWLYIETWTMWLGYYLRLLVGAGMSQACTSNSHARPVVAQASEETDISDSGADAMGIIDDDAEIAGARPRHQQRGRRGPSILPDDQLFGYMRVLVISLKLGNNSRPWKRLYDEGDKSSMQFRVEIAYGDQSFSTQCEQNKAQFVSFHSNEGKNVHNFKIKSSGRYEARITGAELACGTLVPTSPYYQYLIRFFFVVVVDDNAHGFLRASQPKL